MSELTVLQKSSMVTLRMGTTGHLRNHSPSRKQKIRVALRCMSCLSRVVICEVVTCKALLWICGWKRRGTTSRCWRAMRLTRELLKMRSRRLRTTIEKPKRTKAVNIILKLTFLTSSKLMAQKCCALGQIKWLMVMPHRCRAVTTKRLSTMGPWYL